MTGWPEKGYLPVIFFSQKNHTFFTKYVVHQQNMSFIQKSLLFLPFFSHNENKKRRCAEIER